MRRPRGAKRRARRGKRCASRDDIIDDEIGARWIHRMRGAKCAAHIFKSRCPRERYLRFRVAYARKQRRIKLFRSAEAPERGERHFLGLIESAFALADSTERDRYDDRLGQSGVGIGKIVGERCGKQHTRVPVPVILHLMDCRADARIGVGKERYRFKRGGGCNPRRDERKKCIA